MLNPQGPQHAPQMWHRGGFLCCWGAQVPPGTGEIPWWLADLWHFMARKTIGKPWENGGLMGFHGISWDFMGYTLWWTNIAMERSTIFHGKIHYFDWAIFNCELLVHQRVLRRVYHMRKFMKNSWKTHETTWCLSLGSCIWLGQAALRSLCYRGTGPRLEGVEKETPEVSHGTLQEKWKPARRFSKILEMALFFFVSGCLFENVCCILVLASSSVEAVSELHGWGVLVNSLEKVPWRLGQNSQVFGGQLGVLNTMGRKQLK